MHLKEEGKFVRMDIWREGKWLDLWSVVHFLSGVAMGFFPKYLGLEIFSAYLITFLILVLYEMFEALAKIKETRSNRFMDIVVGMASFALAHSLHPLISEPAGILALIVFFAAASAMGFIGWRASQKAAVFEAKFKEEIARGRARIQTRLRERRNRRRLNKINGRL